jgi:hypothetical protein
VSVATLWTTPVAAALTVIWAPGMTGVEHRAENAGID